MVLRRGLALLPPRVAVDLVGGETSLVYEHNVGLLLHQLNHPWNKLEDSVASCRLLLRSLHKLLVDLALLDPLLVVDLPQTVWCNSYHWVAVVERLATLGNGQMLLLEQGLAASKEGDLLFCEDRLLVFFK